MLLRKARQDGDTNAAWQLIDLLWDSELLGRMNDSISDSKLEDLWSMDVSTDEEIRSELERAVLAGSTYNEALHYLRDLLAAGVLSESRFRRFAVYVHNILDFKR